LSFARQCRTLKMPEKAKCGKRHAKKVSFGSCAINFATIILGCTEHPTLKTPNTDVMAKRGTRLSNAYVQLSVCDRSRMSFHTVATMRSRGSHWNGWPLRIGEPTPGDQKIGGRNVLVGTAHMPPDLEGMKIFGITSDSIIGVPVAESGFKPCERDDGPHPTGSPRPQCDTYQRARIRCAQFVGALS
jgi:hypothetical protein